MLSLLNTLLHYYRLDTGKEQAECCPFRLRSLIDTLAAEYAPAVAAKRLEFITAVSYTHLDVYKRQVENSEGINPQKDETAVRTFVDEHIMLVRPGAAASSHDPGRGIKL